MTDINPKNPDVAEAIANAESKTTLLSIAESVTYERERYVERGFQYTEVDLRIHALNYAFKHRELAYKRDAIVFDTLADADVFLTYLQAGGNQ